MTAQFAEVKAGAFVRQPNHFTDRITADGSSDYPVEAGRYVLYVCLACPWAHRSVIVRRLLGLEDAIALRVVDPIRDEKHIDAWDRLQRKPYRVAGEFAQITQVELLT